MMSVFEIPLQGSDRTTGLKNPCKKVIQMIINLNEAFEDINCQNMIPWINAEIQCNKMMLMSLG